MRYVPRALAAALIGAMAGPACLVLFYSLAPRVVIDFDHDAPGITSGFYPVEHVNGRSVAWTRGNAALRLEGLDRRAAWSCTFSLAGLRADPATLPDLTVAIDGVVAAGWHVAADFAETTIPVPMRPDRPGAAISLSSSKVFVPGPQDPRRLGVLVDRVVCEPQAGARVMPPRRLLRGSAVGAAAFGLAAGLTGVTPGSAILAALALGLGQAVPLARGLAPYTPFASSFVWFAVAIALCLSLGARLAETWQHAALRNTARFAAIFTAGAAYLELLGLLHPDKALIDAAFQAHRLGDVLAGRFYFTSLTPSGVVFPYGISLYLVAAPFAELTANHITLLRIVVIAMQALAGLVLYPMLARVRGDRLAAAVAVALFHFVPLSYGVVGSGNLTNAFGENLALVAVGCAILWPLSRTQPARLALLVLIVTGAFIAHLGTLGSLATTLVALSVLFVVRGSSTRAPGFVLAAVLAVALAVSMAAYYGHFMNVYLQQGSRLMASGNGSGETSGSRLPLAGSSRPRATSPAPRPLVALARQLPAGVGWPIFLLAIAGIWGVRRGRTVDRTVLAIAAWLIMCLTLGAIAATTPVRLRFYYAAVPGFVLLAGIGMATLWRSGRLWRAVSVLLAAGATATGVAAWAEWFA